ncbi:hypothetical protein EAS54_30485 [Bradyrhizobium guangzhouense]|uniref:Uncharacterized protein n=1 Tax=Bradyrhizobium guangzhouense TaxID=1325095 RepID=A0AAE5X4D0_9BRAD|nr:hypothetical protein XH91_25815 [Bradyrhizobium guangzhouense]RXH06405.1 hypothetical protein EAS56_34240 [Bradyrhizobium guangzhouense]RXH10838.1 hypothetical protein EAS54_30485 [Bradyrhizobium guangzhouense]
MPDKLKRRGNKCNCVGSSFRAARWRRSRCRSPRGPCSRAQTR